MAIKRSALILLLVSAASVASAQLLATRVDLHVREESLGKVLHRLEESYAISFVYSRSFVPVEQKVSYSQTQQPLGSVLESLLEEASIIPVERNGFIVLKPNILPAEELSVQEKPPRETVTSSETPSLPKKNSTSSPQMTDAELAASFREREKRLAELPLIETQFYESLPGGDKVYVPTIDQYRRQWQLTSQPERAEETSSYRKAQVTVLPILGTNFTESHELTNKVSVNLLWGINGGVDGVEVGGIVNTVYENVEGVQVAGLGNTVRGQVQGTQVGGFFNLARQEVRGVQVAGLFNISGASSATQVAGLFNYSRGLTSGTQTSLFFNRAKEGADLVQVSGIFNRNGGNAQLQASLLYNRAENVRSGQYSLFYNKAREVRGVQLGLINVADTVSGIPIGLFNIIKKGYNRFELATSEIFWVNTGYKFGAQRFYNILRLGMRWDDLNPDMTVETPVSWTLGYGLGTLFRLGSGWSLHAEGVVQHVNELEGWTDQLNLLTRFEFSFDRVLWRRLSFFAGPNFSILASDRRNAESGEYESHLLPYTFHQKTRNGRTVSMWIGFSGGLRF